MAAKGYDVPTMIVISAVSVLVAAVVFGDRFAPSAAPAQAPVTGQTVATAAKLPPDVVARCRKQLALGSKIGLIRAMPTGNLIKVDERMWDELSFDDKRLTLRAVSCSAFQQSMPPDQAYVVAQGWRSGDDLLTLTAYGTIK